MDQIWVVANGLEIRIIERPPLVRVAIDVLGYGRQVVTGLDGVAARGEAAVVRLWLRLWVGRRLPLLSRFRLWSGV